MHETDGQTDGVQCVRQSPVREDSIVKSGQNWLQKLTANFVWCYAISADVLLFAESQQCTND